MKILLFGRGGQLGWELQQSLAPRGEVKAVDKSELDISQVKAIPAYIKQSRPTVIVNAASYTDVDKAEDEKELAHRINAIAPEVMARTAKEIGATFIHFSTDYVFDGEKGTPYLEQDLPNPINHYGRTKFEGEQAIQGTTAAHIIIRTSWLYSMKGPSFPTKVLQWARSQEIMQVVDDQIGNTTLASELADGLWKIVKREKGGIFNIAGAEIIDRYAFALKIADVFDLNKNLITPIKTEDLSQPAPRPLNSGLNINKAEKELDICMSNATEGLEKFKNQLVEEMSELVL